MCAIQSVVKDPVIPCHFADVYWVYFVAHFASVTEKVMKWHFSKITFSSLWNCCFYYVTVILADKMCFVPQAVVEFLYWLKYKNIVFHKL